MATVRVETFDGVEVFEHVSHIWNTSVHGDRIDGCELLARGSLEIIHNGGEKTLIDCDRIKSFSFGTP